MIDAGFFPKMTFSRRKGLPLVMVLIAAMVLGCESVPKDYKTAVPVISVTRLVLPASSTPIPFQTLSAPTETPTLQPTAQTAASSECTLAIPFFLSVQPASIDGWCVIDQYKLIYPKTWKAEVMGAAGQNVRFRIPASNDNAKSVTLNFVQLPDLATDITQLSLNQILYPGYEQTDSEPVFGADENLIQKSYQLFGEQRVLRTQSMKGDVVIERYLWSAKPLAYLLTYTHSNNADEAETQRILTTLETMISNLVER